jgi:hypothetical protein
MKQIIFYGAGRNAAEKLKLWEEQGLVPVCFSDSDVSKHYAKFSGYKILPLQEAIQCYPDYEIYLTQGVANLKHITDYLLAAGIPIEYIKYCEPVEYRKGCYHLDNSIVIATDFIAPCCWKKHILISDTVHSENSIKCMIGEYHKWLAATLEKIRLDKTTDCDECPNFKQNFWAKRTKIIEARVASGFNNTICNCNCLYCTLRTEYIGKKQELDGYDIFRILSEEFDSIEKVFLSDGEITVMPHRDKLFQLIKTKKWYVNINTNALVFNQDIADLMKDNLANLVVSLDSGTPNTYHKVKRVNAFTKVVGNIEKYAKTGGVITLKYIMLPELNDNFEDINGFLGIAKQLNITNISLSNDLGGIAKLSQPRQNISEKQFSMYAYFAARCKEHKIRVNYVNGCFTKSDCLRMDYLM